MSRFWSQFDLGLLADCHGAPGDGVPQRSIELSQVGTREAPASVMACSHPAAGEGTAAVGRARAANQGSMMLPDDAAGSG
jgi:hypothetical protein